MSRGIFFGLVAAAAVLAPIAISYGDGPAQAATTLAAASQAASTQAGGSQSRPAAATRPAPLSREDLRKYLGLEREVLGLFADKKYEEAADVCRRQIEIAPGISGPYYNLACAMARLDKKEEAFAALKQAMEQGYSEPDHMRGDEDLEALHPDKRFDELVRAAQANADTGAGYRYDKGQEMPGLKTVEGTVKNGLRYRLRMDPNATRQRPERLIVWLHPSGGYGNNMVEAMAPMFGRHGFALLVFTQKNAMGWSQEDMLRGSRTAKAIGGTEAVDPNRLILMGFSAGGQAALTAWQSSAGAIGGLILDAAYPVSSSDYASGHIVTMTLPKDAAVRDVPIFVAVGALDGGSKLWGKVHKDWLAAGVPLSVHYVPGGKHQWLFNKATTAELDKWLEDVAAGKIPTNQPASAPATAPVEGDGVVPATSRNQD